MKFKSISAILLLFSFDILVLSSPVKNKKKCVVKSHISDETKRIKEIKGKYFMKDTEAGYREKTNEFEDYDDELFKFYDNENVCNTKECIQVSNNLLNSIDSSVDPCEDFYQFTCGNWMKNNIADEVTESVNCFSNADNINKESLIKILEKDYQPKKNLSKENQEYDEKVFNKMKSFYNSCMDIDKINEKGGKPVMDLINQLKINDKKDKYTDIKELSKTLAKIHDRKVIHNPFFDIDFLIGEEKQIYLSLVETASLTEDDEKSVSEIKKDIKNLLEKIYKDSEEKDFDKMVNSIIDLDEKLFGNVIENNYDEDDKSQKKFSNKHIMRKLNLNSKLTGIKWKLNLKSKAVGDDDDNENNLVDNESEFYSIDPISVKSLNERYSSLDWKLYLKERFENIGMKGFITDDTEIVIMDEVYFEKLNRILSEVDSETLSNYFEWNIIMNFLSFLPKEYRYAYNQSDEEIEKSKIPRSDSCYELVNEVMDMAVGEYFVEDHFSLDKKYYAEKVIEYIKQSMINRIPEMEWLDDETIEYAYKKVAAMTETIGYQDYIMNPEKLYKRYESIEISDDEFFKNIVNHSVYKNGNYLKSADSISDLSLTDIAPQTVNAQYILDKNSMDIPAGILQPPFFSSGIPDYINYGGIGSLIGHELTHAFDNTGKNYDMNGNIYNWWTDNDLEEYEDLTKCFIKQYDKFYVEDNKGEKHYIDGKMTLDENLADSGGLARAYESWRLSLKEDPETVKKENPPLPGLTQYTPDQLFFISFGHHWCESFYRDPNYVDIYLNDEHAPGVARVNGVVSNSRQFAKAFNCPLKSKMNPEKKCTIW